MTKYDRCVRMIRVGALLLGTLFWLQSTGLVFAEEITPAGKQLTEVLDSMHVERLWLVGQRVHWDTGEALGDAPVVSDKKYAGHTHCSAFAAAAAAKLGVYLLHPPEHSSILLANAQQDWLKAAGTNQGWFAVATPKQAQHLANQGELVVATFKSANPKSSGHIAIIRPSTKSDALIQSEGPQVTQAGKENYVSGTVKEGFKNHAGAFEKNEVLYFAHPLKLPLAAE